MAIIDDDQNLCRSLGGYLLAAGIRAVPYHSAEEFLADTGRPRFDCLLLDIQLGGMSGIELNQRLTMDGWTTPVIFNTAYDDQEIRARAQRSGCAAYVLKTDPGQTLLETIRNTLKPSVADPLEPGRRPSAPKQES